MPSQSELQKYYERFEQNRGAWAQHHQGEYVLLRGDDAEAFFPDYESAYKAGLDRYGRGKDFLIQQVCAVEPVFVIY